MKIQYPFLLNDWHPVASLDEFEHTAIIGTRLLGEDIVLWQEGDRYHAWQDLCIHHGTRLSLGASKMVVWPASITVGVITSKVIVF